MKIEAKCHGNRKNDVPNILCLTRTRLRSCHQHIRIFLFMIMHKNNIDRFLHYRKILRI